MSILISELSTTPPLVFSEWTSPSASRDLAPESARERAERQELASSSASPPTMPSFGSSRPSEAPSSTEEQRLPTRSSLLPILRSRGLLDASPFRGAVEALRWLPAALHTILLCQTTGAPTLSTTLRLLSDFSLMEETNLLFFF